MLPKRTGKGSATPIIDMTGRIIGRLEVLSISTERKHGKVSWLCRCSCGNFHTATGKDLRSGSIQSCGCLGTERRSESVTRRNTKHRMTGTPTYRSWSSMIGRCTNPKNPDYLDYGGKGITVCDRWLESFENFYSDMGDRPRGKTLDRIDGDQGYFPENCRWATASQQAQNRKSSRLITCNGQTLNLTEWVKQQGIPKSTILNRLNRGWTTEQALGFTQPSNASKTRNRRKPEILRRQSF
jgi:hypothetical protein